MSGAAEPAPRVIPGLRPPSQSLDPAVRRIWALEALGSGITSTLIAFGASLTLAEFTSIPLPLMLVATGLIFLVSVLIAAVVPPITYRHYRWEVTETGLIVQRGWLQREFIAVPHSRIQTVETRRGPLERAVGLASAAVSTAAGVAVRIPGLTTDVAAELQEDLSARTGSGEGA